MNDQIASGPMTDKHLPTDNRELAHLHADAIHRKVDRRGLAISLFAFFATIFTLLWFILANWSGPSADPQVEQAAPEESEQVTIIGSVQQSAGAAGRSSGDSFDFGQPMSDRFGDQQGGWGVQQ